MRNGETIIEGDEGLGIATRGSSEGRLEVVGSVMSSGLAAERGASEQAIGITKGGRNGKIHGLVDKLCRPWVLILTPGNTADCTVGPACVSLLDGIAELLGDKA